MSRVASAGEGGLSVQEIKPALPKEVVEWVSIWCLHPSFSKLSGALCVLRAVQVLGRQWKYLRRVRWSEGPATGAGCGRVPAAPSHPFCCGRTNRYGLEAQPHLSGLRACCCSAIQKQTVMTKGLTREGWHLEGERKKKSMYFKLQSWAGCFPGAVQTRSQSTVSVDWSEEGFAVIKVDVCQWDIPPRVSQGGVETGNAWSVALGQENYKWKWPSVPGLLSAERHGMAPTRRFSAALFSLVRSVLSKIRWNVVVVPMKTKSERAKECK